MSNRRHYSQAALPITLQDIRTYDEDYFAYLTAWEKRLLCRIDDRVVPIINGRMAKAAKSGGRPEPVMIDASDGKSVAQTFRAIALTKKAKKDV